MRLPTSTEHAVLQLWFGVRDAHKELMDLARRQNNKELAKMVTERILDELILGLREIDTVEEICRECFDRPGEPAARELFSKQLAELLRDAE